MKKIIELSELQQPATKGDILLCASKEDLVTLATKDDLNSLGTELRDEAQAMRRELKGEIGTVKKDVTILKNDVRVLRKDVGALRQTVDHHTEMLEFMRENMVTRDELYVIMRQSFTEFKNEMLTSIDAIVTRVNTQELEHYALRSSHLRLETTVGDHLKYHETIR